MGDGGPKNYDLALPPMMVGPLVNVFALNVLLPYKVAKCLIFRKR